MEATEVGVGRADLGPMFDRQRRQVRVGRDVARSPSRFDESAQHGEVALGRLEDKRARLVKPTLNDVERFRRFERLVNEPGSSRQPHEGNQNEPREGNGFGAGQ
jgi:hypothetical protein